MGNSIRCKHCGTETIILADWGFMQQLGRKIGVCHIETETAIRCPQCMKRLNNTEDEFNEQIVGSLCWD